uniref:Stonustoxin subunit beta n=1 Tax=Maylandia zebra TaxID=106582 RepID=A0A3P9D7U7_9CICH
MASDTMTVAGLGRPFDLGMLYNALTDEPICGFTLWDDRTLQEHTVERPQRSSTFETSACDSIESRCSLLGLEPSLKASFLSGCVEVGGSGKYLTDKKTFKNQSRVTIQYQATTSLRNLSASIIGTINEPQRQIIESISATHIVTGILYGANALFAFDSEKLDSSQVKDIQGSMDALIKNIHVDGKLKVELTKEEKDLSKKFSCKFFGDFILDSNPTTFEEAMKTIAELPRILKEQGENAVPIKVWLTPLKTLGYGGAELEKDISVDSLRRIEDTLEALKEMKERCNDSLDEVVVKHFPQIKKYLQKFQKLCSDKISHLQRALKRVLPSIREGRADESSLNDVFDDLDKSPYNLGNLSKCLDYREREINIIRSFLGRMEGIKIVQNKSELDRAVLATGVNHAFCFVFTGLKDADLNLDAMANEDPWYYLNNTLDHMKEVAAIFMDLYRAYESSTQLCFLVAAIQHQNHKGATIYHYKEGRMITDHFSKPKIRDPRTIKKRSHFLWNYCHLTLDPDTANNYLTLSEDNKKATCGKWQTYPDHPERFDKHTQVLCKQPLTGRHYWEVEWSAGYMLSDVGIAVAYKEIGRKGRMDDLELGCNKISWKVFSLTRLGRVGVYLDWPAGTLSFYDASSNSDKLVHLYTFETKFSESVYPGFYIYYPSNYLDFGSLMVTHQSCVVSPD